MKFVLSNLPVKVSQEEIENMINIVDEDKNGEIDFDEFRTMIGF